MQFDNIVGGELKVLGLKVEGIVLYRRKVVGMTFQIELQQDTFKPAVLDSVESLRKLVECSEESGWAHVGR